MGRSYDVAVNKRASIPELWEFDAKIASALKRIISNPFFKRRVSLEEQKAQTPTDFLKEDRLLTWSTNISVLLALMMLFLIWQIYLVSVSFQGDDIQDFDTRWDQALMSTCEVPKDNVLESLYKMRTTRVCSASDCISNVRPRNWAKIDRNQVVRSWKPKWEETHWSNDQKRATSKPGTKELKQEWWPRIIKGKTSALNGEQQNAISWKQLDSVQKEILAASAMTTVIIKKESRIVLSWSEVADRLCGDPGNPQRW